MYAARLQIDILQKTTDMYEQDKRALQQELETREHRLQSELSERKRMEQRMQGAVTDTRLKWEKECVSGVVHCFEPLGYQVLEIIFLQSNVNLHNYKLYFTIAFQICIESPTVWKHLYGYTRRLTHIIYQNMNSAM